MLNETYLLWQALNRAKLDIPREHPRVKSPGKTGPCLRVRLEEQGHVTAVEVVTEDEWPGLWTVMEGNQNSFPVVRVKEPLSKTPRGSEIWKRLGFDEKGKRKKTPDTQARLTILTEILQSSSQLSMNEDLWSRLRDKAGEFLTYARDDCSEGSILREFAQRFQKASFQPDALLRQAAEHALQSLREARLDALDAVETLLVGKGPPDDRAKQPQMTVQLAFDLHDDLTGNTRLYGQNVRDYVKRILPMEQKVSESKHPAHTCALTGEQQSLQVSPFPKVRLPILNKDFPLASMFSEARCNKRYGLTDSFIVPVAQQTALQMQDALTWIVDDKRKGKTWRGVASGKFEAAKGGKKESFDLLVVYVDGVPEIDVNIADLFGADEEVQQKQFEVDVQAVCKALDGIERERPGSKLNLFLLRKVSEGQALVAVAESPSVEDVLKAAQWWQQAAANVPEVTLPLPGKKGERAVRGEPHAPFPDQVVRLLSEEWIRNGTRSNKICSIDLSEVLDLMLRKPGKWEPTAQHMLDLAVRRLGPLLLGVFGVVHANDFQRWDDYPIQSRETALRAVSTLGILLDAIGRKKEMYMNGVAFLVGRLLSLADTLHREYCQHVRGGDIPPQLIGNALMPVAADNPKDAVDRLRERLMIYKAWADKGNGEEFRLGKWAVGRMGEVCHKLSQLSLPTETDQTFRAELFLGYMARSVSEKGQDDGSIDQQKEVGNVE